MTDSRFRPFCSLVVGDVFTCPINGSELEVLASRREELGPYLMVRELATTRRTSSIAPTAYVLDADDLVLTHEAQRLTIAPGQYVTCATQAAADAVTARWARQGVKVLR